MFRPGSAPLFLLVLLVFAPVANALELRDCRISAGPSFPGMKARCGALERPVNPDSPDDGTLSLRVVVVPALNLKPEPDPVVPIAGGPGQSSVQFYAAYASAFEPLRRDRDILLVDQRGTGDSARLDCALDDQAVDSTYSTEQAIRATEECLDQLPYDPRYFTTSVAVRDLDAVRDALGYAELNVYGISYGSRVAQHYARRYPASTRTVTLDGVLPPRLPLGPDIAIESQRALDDIFTRCEQESSCNRQFPELATQFAELKNRLDTNPVRVRSADPLTGEVSSVRFGRNEMASALRLLAYSPQSIAMIPLLVSEAARRNYRPLIAQFRMTQAKLADALALGMHNAIMCTEDAPYYDQSRIDRDSLRASYMGPMQLEALEAICSVWPRGLIDEDLRTSLATDIPVLLLSGTADPITPPRYADMAARNLMRAWLLTGEHQGHGQLTVGCMPRLVADFVANKGLEDTDTSCMRDNFVMPFFLDFAGPAP